MASAFQTVFLAISAIAAVYYSGKSPFVLRWINEIVHGKPGCNPIESVGNVTIHYFAMRGRAESMRILMKEAEIPFSEINFNEDIWPEYKSRGTKDGLYTFSQVPAIETVSGVQLSQSLAIVHYLGRSAGYDCDCEHLETCEVLAFGIEDFTTQLSKIIYNPEFSFKDRATYLTETLPLWMGHFEKLAPSLAKQDGAFFVGDRQTWIDFLIFEIIDTNKEFAGFDVGAKELSNVDIFAPFPKLHNFYTQMAKRPKINEFLHSKERFSFSIPHIPKN